MKKNTSVKITLALPLVIIAFALGGCFNLGGTGGSSSSQPADQKSRVYETSDFSITIPKAWEVIEKKDFTTDVPEETVVVFRNNVKNENFTANVVIVRNNLQTPTTTLDYAKMVINRQKTGLIGYSESRHDDAKISIGGNDEPTLFVLFEAKKSAQDQTVRYEQTCGVKGQSAWIVTGAMSPQENDSVVKDIENIVKSFKLK